MAGVLRALLEAPRIYLSLAWWGLARPRLVERKPLVVVQAVIRDGEQVLLAVRGSLRGWELPGGNPETGEDDVAALVREVREETGLDVEVGRHIGDYVRTGFRPHTARVFECRRLRGELRCSRETPELRWLPVTRLPDTLFPWCRVPIADAVDGRDGPVRRCEYQGADAVLAGLRIDLQMRLSGDRAGLRDA